MTENNDLNDKYLILEIAIISFLKENNLEINGEKLNAGK